MAETRTENQEPKTKNQEPEVGGQLRWTDKQKEIAQLLQEGKPFKDIIALGYTKSLVSKVRNALGMAYNPEPKPKTSENQEPGDNGKRNLVGLKAPKSSPILFTINKKEIALDPLELNTQYRFYQDIAKRDGMSYSFSEVQTIGIQLVWMLMQDIPLTENMVMGILYG